MKTVIVDLEATCCDDDGFPRDEMEIIEIGAVFVGKSDDDALEEFQTFIKPSRHSQLTDFCKKLTSIRQEEIDRAPGFKLGFSSFLEWFYRFGEPCIASWGDYDLRQIFQDCELHRFPKPQFRYHRNLRKEFSASLGTTERFEIDEALERVGLQLDGTHHRGIDDARNIVKIFRYLEEKSQVPGMWAWIFCLFN